MSRLLQKSEGDAARGKKLTSAVQNHEIDNTRYPHWRSNVPAIAEPPYISAEQSLAITEPAPRIGGLNFLQKRTK